MESSRFARMKQRIVAWWQYCAGGVWHDTRKSAKVNIVKTLNLSVRSFFNSDIQSRACAMTFRTMLAIVPALALIFAFGRGFGLENVIEDELIAAMPSQKIALSASFKFVDSYLDSSSEGVFLGIGIVFLLWTLVSLLSSVEDSFNQIWGVRNGRTYWRKITDYLVIFILLPVLMICSSGVTIFVTTLLETTLSSTPISPLLSVLLDLSSLVLIWLFFTGLYMMVPNTKVRFRSAFISGILAGTAYVALQWLFLTGQLYVSKYNAVYGGFAFLPLLLIWLQLVWVITLAGAVICYASQNFSKFNFSSEISQMSYNYRSQIAVSIMAVSVYKYEHSQPPMNELELSVDYGLPASLVSQLINNLVDCGLLLKVISDNKNEPFGYLPSVEPEKLSVGEVMKKLRMYGTNEFVPEFDKRFHSVATTMKAIDNITYKEADKTLIRSLKVSKIKK